MVAIQIFASLLNSNYVYTMSIYKIQDTMMMGADYYQTESEIASLLAEGKVPIGVGQNTKIKWVPSLSLTHIVQRKNNFHLLPHQGNHTCVFDIRIDFHKTMLNRSFTIFVFFLFRRNCIIDKNAKIGKNVIIANAEVSIPYMCAKVNWCSWKLSSNSKHYFIFVYSRLLIKCFDFSGCSRSRQTKWRILHSVRDHSHSEECNN